MSTSYACHVESTLSVDDAWCVVSASGSVRAVFFSLEEARRYCEKLNGAACGRCTALPLCRPGN